MCVYINIISALLIACNLMGGITPNAVSDTGWLHADSFGHKQVSDIDGGRNARELQPPTRRRRDSDSEIKHQSNFLVYKTAPSGRFFFIDIGPNATRIEHYDRVLRPSPYMNADTGIYTVPVDGKYRFTVNMFGLKGHGSVNWFVRGREWKAQLIHDVDGRFLYFKDDIVWECDKGEEVWLEAVAWQTKMAVKTAGFHGELIE